MTNTEFTHQEVLEHAKSMGIWNAGQNDTARIQACMTALADLQRIQDEHNELVAAKATDYSKLLIDEAVFMLERAVAKFGTKGFKAVHKRLGVDLYFVAYAEWEERNKVEQELCLKVADMKFQLDNKDIDYNVDTAKALDDAVTEMHNFRKSRGGY